MKQLLAPATTAILEDANKECPFGAAARSKGDITAEERWVHLRGSIHSASLLQQMMDIAQDVRDSFDLNSTPSINAPQRTSGVSLQHLMDRARIASYQLRRVQLESEAVAQPKAEKSGEISQDLNKLSQPQQAMVTFSWDAFLKPGCYPPEIPPTPVVYEVRSSSRRRGTASESNSGSTTTLGSPSSASPHRHAQMNGNRQVADTRHRPLGSTEMKRYGLLPLEDDRNLRQCQVCKRVLLETVFATHAMQCKEAMRRTLEGIDPNVPRGASISPSENVRNVTSTTNTTMSQTTPQPIARAASNEGISVQPQRPPVLPRSNSASPVPAQSQFPSNQPPRSGFGPHPSSAAARPIPVATPPPTGANPSAKLPSPTLVPTSAGNISPAARGAPITVTTQFGNTAPSGQVTPTKSPTTPRSINSMNKSGGIVLVGSPRMGLKSSIGQSSLLSSSGTIQHAHHPQHSPSYPNHQTYGQQQYVYQPHSHSGPGPSPAPTATAYIVSPPQTPQGGFKRAFNSMSSPQRPTEHEGMDEASLRGAASHKRVSHGAPHHSAGKHF